MRIKQIDVSEKFATCKSATLDERHKIFSEIAQELEHCFSVLNYEDTLCDRDTELHGIRKPKDKDKTNLKSAGDNPDTNQFNSLLVKYQKAQEEIANTALPLLEGIVNRDASFNAIAGKFNFNQGLDLFSKSTKERLREFGNALNDYAKSVVDPTFTHNEPKVEIYQDDLFEKDDVSKKILGEFLDWRRRNRPQTLFTIFQEVELNDWGHADTKLDYLIKKSPSDWLSTIFGTDVSNYEYLAFSGYWYEFGDYFEPLVRSFWQTATLQFSEQNGYVLVSNPQFGQLKIRFNTFINLFMFAPGGSNWDGGKTTASYFQELLLTEETTVANENIQQFSKLLGRHYQENAILPKISHLTAWESLCSFTASNNSNALFQFEIMGDQENFDSAFYSFIQDMSENAPFLLPYIALGDLHRNDFYPTDWECCQFKKAFVMGASRDFNANAFITYRMHYANTLYAIGFNLIAEGVVLLTVTDLLMLDQMKALEWRKIHSFIDKQDISKTTKELVLTLINEHPQEESENLRSFRHRFKDELAQTDPLHKRVKELIQGGETKYVEFKETLSWDVNTKTKEKRIEESALKAICGFMNADGGTLLIGVNDQGQALGVDFEIKKLHKNDDKFSLHLKNLIKDRLGSGALTQVNHRVINFNGSKIVVIECPKSEKETWLDKREFYVRSHPSTDRLDGPELLQYCRERFNS